MFKNNVFQSKVLVLGLVGAFALLILPKDGLAQAGSGAMTGFVFGTDLRTPVASAVVKLRNVQNGREYQSAPTDPNGLYSLKNLPEGRYILGVSSTKGDFNFDYELQIKANEIAKLAVALKPGAASLNSQDEDQNKKRKKAFFLTPLGIAVLIAAGALLIYGGIKLFESNETSPSKR